MSIIPVILSGGSGTRLWPMSRRSQPKQFAALTGDLTLFQQTVHRSAAIEGSAAPIVVGNVDHADMIAEQLAGIGVAPMRIIVEPAARNTAPAVAVAAQALDADDLMLVMPSDHLFADPGAFTAAVHHGVAPASHDRLVTFGVTPTRPETGYGYIEVGDERDGWSEVVRFVEKPDLETAQAYLEGGRHVWNAGIFLFAAGSLISELNAHAPDVADAAAAAWSDRSGKGDIVRPGDAFLASPSISIDNAVMETSDQIAVVSLDAGWNDVGSWQALWEVGIRDANANVVVGEAVLDDVSGSYIRSQDRLIAVLGLEDVVVVDTPDALLIASRERSQDVKNLLEGLDSRFR